MAIGKLDISPSTQQYNFGVLTDKQVTFPILIIFLWGISIVSLPN